MERLLKEFSESPLADEAFNQLAKNDFYRSEIDRSLAYFTQLQDFPRAHDFEDTAYFFPALALVARNRAGDLDAADQLFTEYVERYPNGVFRQRCIFWRGRIAEKRGDPGAARRLFQSLIDDAPYEYYSVRAGMHIEEGTGAIGRSIPAVDSSLRRELKDAYLRSRSQPVGPLGGTTPYHERLRFARTAGLYARLIDIDRGLGERLDNIPLDQLDDTGLVPAAAMLLALRRDTLAARDSDPSPDNWFQLIRFLTGDGVGDWSMAVEMTTAGGSEARRRLRELQKDPPYLATMYPDLDTLTILEEPLVQGAWPIEGSPGLSESLMYAVIRQESGFYTAAISQMGAVGLFQFMPATFDGLDRRWGLLRDSAAASEVDYLIDPARNIALWARWVTAEFPIRNRDGIASALMRHQAGSGNVSNWDRYWLEVGLENDLEYQIETARFAETRNFLRRVLTDTTIIDAVGLFDGSGN